MKHIINGKCIILPECKIPELDTATGSSCNLCGLKQTTILEKEVEFGDALVSKNKCLKCTPQNTTKLSSELIGVIIFNINAICGGCGYIIGKI